MQPIASVRPPGHEIGSALEAGKRAWADVRSFDIGYGRVNCFHSAVVVEVAGEGPKTLAGKLHGERQTFLPHLTLGSVNRPSDPAPLREVLIRRRNVELGRQRVESVALCVVPASRRTFLDPWHVVGTASLQRR